MPNPPRTDPLFEQPSSMIIWGSNRTLLKWVAYAIALQSRSTFIWTDLRLHNEELVPTDPLARNLVPPDRLSVAYPEELRRDERSKQLADAAIGGVIRADESPEAVRKVAGFLGLPHHTQEMLAGIPSGGPPPIVVLSNGHRLVALYPPGSVEPTIRAIVDYGVVFILTFADEPGPTRLAFDTVLTVRGHDDLRSWRDAVLRVEKAVPAGPFVPGFEARLGQIPLIATVLDAAQLG